MSKIPKNDEGFILVDILVALMLAALFIAILSESSTLSRGLFARSHDRSLLLDAYDAGVFTEVERPYGNDRTEVIQTVTASLSTTSRVATTTLYPSYISFNSVKLNDPTLSNSAGTPLCLIDQMHKGAGVHITPIVLPIYPSMPLTDVEVRNDIAYIGADSAVASDPDIYVIDITDSSNPRLLSSINTGPGISALALAGNRIFAGAQSTAAQLHMIRIDSLTKLVLEKKFKLPLPYATATLPLASSIFYNRGYIYLGTEKWDGNEINIINVSDPLQPTVVGGYETGSKVNDIMVRDGVAYIAAADQYQLRLIDARDPTSLQFIRGFSPSGWQRQEGKVISIFEGGLYLGRTSGGYNVIQDHEAFAWASTSSTTLTNPYSADIPGGVYGVVADRRNMYLATRQVGKELQIFNQITQVSTSSGDMTYLPLSSYPLAASAQAMTCDGSRLYVLGHNVPILYEISFY